MASGGGAEGSGSGSESGSGPYGDGERAFLQALMARGTLRLKEAQRIVAAISTARSGTEMTAEAAAQVTADEVDGYAARVSGALSALDYQVRGTLHQMTRRREWALVNTTSDAFSQLATLHSAEEIGFVRRVVDAMFDRYNRPRMECMCLNSFQANKLCRPRPADDADADADADEDEAGDEAATTKTTQKLRGIKSGEAEALLASMLAEGWFEQGAGAGLYTLSPRALMELRSWLVETYNDPDAAPDEWQRIKFCEACREIVTMGLRCPDMACNVRLHEICQQAYWRTRKEAAAAGKQTCPRCGCDWSGNRNYVGEKAVTSTAKFQSSQREAGLGRSSGFIDLLMQEPTDEDDEDDEDDDAGRNDDDDERWR